MCKSTEEEAVEELEAVSLEVTRGRVPVALGLGGRLEVVSSVSATPLSVSLRMLAE